MTHGSIIRKYQMEILLAVVILLSAFLNIWNIWNQGYSNTYYAAAVKSMLGNPDVLFFNSFDAGGFVTVDKPPLGLWVQAASAALLGFSGWALVLPQALAGVGSVALIYCIVSRPFGKPAGLIAALALAVTPIFVAVSRNGTMDGLLIFVLLLALWIGLKAARENSLTCLLLAVILVGLGFNIKMIQAFIVVPAVIGIYLLGAGGIPMKKRLLHIGLAIAVLSVVSLSWAVVVDMIPADQRPYIGGSGDNTVMGLIINYNGLHRLENGMQSPGGNGAFLHDNNAGMQGGPGGMIPGSAVSLNQTADRTGQGMQSLYGNREFSPRGDAALQEGSGDIPLSLALSRNQTADRAGTGMLSGAGTIPGQGMVPPEGNMPQGIGPGTTTAQGGRIGGGMMDETGNPGLFRLFGSGLAGQISWLLPFALIGLLAFLKRPESFSLKGFLENGYFSERGLTILAMCLWLFPGIAYFSFTTGFWHTYYLATIAPPLAALAGISAAALYHAYFEKGIRSWLLIAAVLITGSIQVLILNYNEEWSGTLVLIIANAILGITAILAFVNLKQNHRSDRVPKILIAIAVGVLFIAPFIWACTPLAYGSGNLLPVAGPQLVRSGGGSPGDNGGPGIGSTSSGLTSYLISHHQGEQWIVAVGSSMEAANIILSTDEPVMALGGFSGSDQILTTDSLKNLINEGKIRYFSTTGISGDRGGSSGNGAVASWVSSNCAVVASSEYNTAASAGMSPGGALQDSRAINTSRMIPAGLSGTVMTGPGQTGGNVLYDCKGAAGSTTHATGS
jgi:4-amino-4-deoxy-L-arabinose transferase-like glycosyltransferase